MLNTLKIIGLASLLIVLATCGGSGGGGGGGATVCTVYTNQKNNVTTIAGTPRVVGAADGTGAAALFNWPSGITVAGGDLYVADTNNNTIRKIVIATGAVTTIAGIAGISGSADAPQGPGTSATFNGPAGITTDGKNLFVTDFNNDTIRQIVIANGAVTTLAGIAGSHGSNDGIGPAASFYAPIGITISPDGTTLYVADTYNSTIRQIVIATADVLTIAGSPGTYGWVDATGTSANFYLPQGITTDGTNLYVADTGNSLIRKILILNRSVTTMAGSPPILPGLPSIGDCDGTGTGAYFNNPDGITTDGTNLYVADTTNSTIRQVVIATATVSTIAGTAGNYGHADGTGAAASFLYPVGITTDGTNLYVADTQNSTIREIH